MLLGLWNKFSSRYEEPRKAVTVFLLCMINVLNYMDRYIVFGILGEIQAYFHLSNGQMGLLQTIFLTVYILCSFTFGVLGDWLPRKHTIIFGVIFWSIFSFISSLPAKNGYVLFYVARSLIGVGVAAIATLGFTVIGDIYTGTPRTRSIGFFLAAMPFGSGLGFIVGPQMISSPDAWHPALRLIPFVGFTLAILLFIIMKEPRRGEADIIENAKNNLTPPDLQDSSLRESDDKDLSILRSFYEENLRYFYLRKSFISFTLGYTSISFVFGGLAVWLPHYLLQLNSQLSRLPGHLTDSKLVGLLFGIATAGTGLIGVLIGAEITASFRTRRRPIELYICIASCISAAITVYFSIYFSFNNLTLTWIFMVITLLILAVSGSPNGDLIMLTIGPLYRSRASAIQIVFIHALGDAISPLIIGSISDHFRSEDSEMGVLKGLHYTLYITPFFLLFGALAYTLAIFEFHKDHQSTINETNDLIKNSVVHSLIQNEA